MACKISVFLLILAFALMLSESSALLNLGALLARKVDTVGSRLSSKDNKVDPPADVIPSEQVVLPTTGASTNGASPSTISPPSTDAPMYEESPSTITAAPSKPIVSSTTTAQDTDYCFKGLCKKDQKHIACGNDGKINSTCAGYSEIIELTPEIKENIVRKHNEYRNKLALGEVPNFKPATRMGTMQWHEELARMADLNVKSCTGTHDACRSTFNFRYSGQNIARRTSHQDSIPLDEITRFMYRGIDKWFIEHEICPQDGTTVYSSKKKKSGHFTVMIADRNVYVGCAAMHMKRQKVVFTCNYAWNNMRGMMMYSPGTTASECKTGCNEEYAGLCSIGEKYD